VTPASFIASLASLRFDNAFNPYADACPDHDAYDAPVVRRNNLAMVLDAALTRGVASVWIARDLGYRGGRRTGLPLTDEVHLASHGNLYGSLPLARATRGPIVGERTAHVIWDVLDVISQPVFLWNVFPLHPHAAGNPLSNRCHTRSEREASLPLLVWLLDVLSPRSIFTIGRDAQHALDDLRIAATPVRHPSYGGQRAFVEAMFRYYRVRHPEENDPLWDPTTARNARE
jgi:hypothetical protein